MQHLLKRYNVCAIVINFLAKFLQPRGRPLIVMITDRPHPSWRWTEIMHLLWHPGDSLSTHIRELKVTSGNHVDSKLGQERDCRAIKGIARCNPRPRADPFTLENFHAAPKLFPLLRCGQPRKFALLPSRNEPGIAAHVTMLKTVQRNCPAAILPVTYALPKILNRHIHAQRGIVIVRHHRENRLQRALNQNVLDVRPHAPVHRRANIVKSENISRRVHSLYRSDNARQADGTAATS